MTDATTLVIVTSYDGGDAVTVGPIGELAKLLRDRAYAGGEFEIGQVQAIGPDHRLVDVTFQVTGAGTYDEDLFAHPTVTVTFPDRHTESASYLIDGAA